MSSIQKLYKDYLLLHNYTCEFDGDTIIFCCARNKDHKNTLSTDSFCTVKARYKNNIEDLCKFCRKEKEDKVMLIELQSKIKHKIIEYIDSHNIKYECCCCKRTNKSNKGALLKSSNCPKCRNDVNRKDFGELEDEVEALGFSLLTTKEDYTNTKNIEVICTCGEVWNCYFSDLKRGSKCGSCKTDRTRVTSLEKYGVKHASQNEEIKEKYKATCLKKYGSECFLQSDEGKKQMIEKYGVEYAMQNDSLFSKKSANSFRQRKYKFKDGSFTLILGYEDLALKELESSGLYSKIEAGDSKNIPTFLYDFDGKKHKYFPDIWLPNENTIIEVKSTYYFVKDKDKNLAKALEASKSHRFLFYVYDDRKSKKTVYEVRDNILVIVE